MDILPMLADDALMLKHNPDSLRVRRAEADKTQAEMAEILGVSPSTYALWERPPEPTDEQLRDIARALKCKADDLCREVEVR